MKQSLSSKVAFSNAGLGLVHGIAHQLGGFYNIPHGLANAILLPRVLEYNRPYCMGRLATVAQAMGEKCDNLSVDQASKKAIEAVRRLCDDVKIPKLCDTKFRMEDIDVLAEHALEDTATQTNIVRPTLDDVKTILAKTYYEGIVLKTVQK